MRIKGIQPCGKGSGKLRFPVAEILKPRGFKERRRVHPVEPPRRGWLLWNSSDVYSEAVLKKE